MCDNDNGFARLCKHPRPTHCTILKKPSPSIPLVGSSNTKSCASEQYAAAITICCFSPPDSDAGCRFRTACKRNSSSASSALTFPHNKKRRCKKSYSALHNKAAYFQSEASGFFYRYITEHGDVSKVVTFSTTPRPLPYPLRTGGRPDTYTPASAALPSQPLYQAAFEHVRGLHSLTT